jgi:hypothetical protein
MNTVLPAIAPAPAPARSISGPVHLHRTVAPWLANGVHRRCSSRGEEPSSRYRSRPSFARRAGRRRSPSSGVDAGAIVVHVPTGRRDLASWQALCLALVGVALPAVAFIPDFVQEVFTVIVLVLAGGAVAVFALTQGIGAFRARRAAHESPAIAATAIAISILPMLGALLMLPSLSCYMGEGCGGG